MTRATIAYIPSSHLDLFWLGNYHVCLDRGAYVLKQYIDRCLTSQDETFLVDTPVFLAHFLERHPEYRDAVVRLAHERRLEVGAAYIDRWETLILGESLVRNLLLGKRWCHEVLGVDNAVATHPDLPSMVPQIAQLCAQAGVKYYVTSRKIYETGKVWRHQAPDGSTLLVLNYPRHYAFIPLDDADLPERSRASARAVALEQLLENFPHGIIPIAGSAGDLAARENFRNRYGRDLEAFVAAYRQQHPDLAFTYTVPSRVLESYESGSNLPVHSGEIPSVWGVVPDEEARFFQRDRAWEGQLLAAETLVAIANHLGLPWRPASAVSWQGVHYEHAFFRPNDPIIEGQELNALWRMHVFTQDHNGGGQEGALSTFQKRTMQERGMQYTQAIIAEVLEQIAGQLSATGDHLLVFNPHLQPFSGELVFSVPHEDWAEQHVVVDEDGHALPLQALNSERGSSGMWIRVPQVPAVGYRAFTVAARAAHRLVLTAANHVTTSDDDELIHLETDHLKLEVNKRTGNICTLHDKRRDQVWMHQQMGRIYSLEEVGSDTVLRLSDKAPHEETLLGLEPVECGPLYAQLRVHKRLLNCLVEQTISVWSHQARVDVETRIYWWGKHNQHVRQVIAPAKKAQLSYGSPFYGVGWHEVVPGAAPTQLDEVFPEDYPNYREVQGWLHVQDEHAGLLVCTMHPGFFHSNETLEAVLLRTPPSCGDPRLYWENAGEQCFRFRYVLTDADWRESNVQAIAAQVWRPPPGKLVTAGGQGDLASKLGLLQVDSSSALCSSLYPGDAPHETILRLYDAVGIGSSVLLTGRLSDGEALATDFMHRERTALAGEAGQWRVELPAWGIQTVKLKNVLPDVTRRKLA